MRLLNVHTLQLEEYFGSETPPYAILSHTWAVEEVSFQGLNNGPGEKKRGYDEISAQSLRALLIIDIRCWWHIYSDIIENGFIRVTFQFPPAI